MRLATRISSPLLDRITDQARGARQKGTGLTWQGLCRDIKGRALDWFLGPDAFPLPLSWLSDHRRDASPLIGVSAVAVVRVKRSTFLYVRLYWMFPFSSIPVETYDWPSGASRRIMTPPEVPSSLRTILKCVRSSALIVMTYMNGLPVLSRMYGTHRISLYRVSYPW